MSEPLVSSANIPPIEQPSGIGGWLILPIIGLFMTIILTIANLVQSTQDLMQSPLSFFITDYPIVGAITFLSFFFGVFIISYSGILLLLIYKKDQKLPKMIIYYYILLFVVSGIEYWGVNYIANIFSDQTLAEGSAKDVIRAFVGAVIWCAYFRVSVRVRNTFGNNGFGEDI